MQLTRAADYAVRVMIHLASLPDGTKVRLADLAVAAEAPEKFLAKLLQYLTRADLVASRRGPSGGFELSARARQATIADVVEAIEGPIELNLCLSEKGCDRQEWCPAHQVWAQAQEAMLTLLRRSTIDELAVLCQRRKLGDGKAVPGLPNAAIEVKELNLPADR